MLETFTTLGPGGKDHLWLWEQFKEPSFALRVHPGHDLLLRLISPEERVWFITEDWDGAKKDDNFWVFEGEAGAVQAVLEELPLFEYDVVDQNCAWLLCENHHNLLIGVGRPMVDRMKGLASA